MKFSNWSHTRTPPWLLWRGWPGRGRCSSCSFVAGEGSRGLSELHEFEKAEWWDWERNTVRAASSVAWRRIRGMWSLVFRSLRMKRIGEICLEKKRRVRVSQSQSKLAFLFWGGREEAPTSRAMQSWPHPAVGSLLPPQWLKPSLPPAPSRSILLDSLRPLLPLSSLFCTLQPGQEFKKQTQLLTVLQWPLTTL